MRRHLALGIATALLVVTSATAHAYVRMKVSGQAVKWQRLPVPYKINPTADPRITDGSDITAIKNGFKTWDDANCSDFTSSFAGDTSATAPVRNGQVEIMWPSTSAWVHGSCGSGGCTLAVTNSQFQSSGSTWYIYDADIEFTPYVQFATDGNRSRSDLQSVATHEIGHLLGLDHSPTTTATMYFATGPGDTSQRTLDTDDLNGVCAIYPNGATPIGCTSAAQCDSGQLCMNNRTGGATSVAQVRMAANATFLTMARNRASSSPVMNSQGSPLGPPMPLCSSTAKACLALSNASTC